MSYDGSIKINTEISTDEANSQMMSLENRIEKTANKITELKSKMDAMKDTKLPTKEYEEVSRQIEQATLKLAKLTDKEIEYQNAGATSGAKWDKLQKELDEVRLEIVYAEGELQDLVATGKAFTLGTDSAQFQKLSTQLNDAENSMKVLVKKHDELTDKQQKATNGAKKVGKAYREAGRSGSNGLERIARGLKKLALLSIGVQSIGALMNRIKNSLSDNFKSLYDYSKTYKSAMDQFTSATSAMKNSIAGALAPVIEAVLPYLTRLVEFVTQATNSLSRFFAILTGKKSYTVGVSSVQQTANEVSDIGTSADNAKQSVKELKGELASFDEMNVINQDKGNDGSTGSGSNGKGLNGAKTPATAFKEVALDENEKLDWKELGKSINEKLLEMLKGIDWNKVYQGAKDFGKGLADFLNGLISPELFYEVGKTIASALNTAIYFVLSFAENFDWANLGKSIAASINGFFENFDFKGLAEAINAWVDGIAEMIAEALTNINWKAIFKGLYDFISTLNIKSIALVVGGFTLKKVGGIKGIASIIKKALEGSLVKAFPSGIGATLAEVMTVDVGTLFGAGTLTEIGIGLGTTIAGGLVAGIGGFFAGKKIGEYIAEQLGDYESAYYYKNFHWFGEGGFFPTIGEEFGYFLEDVGKWFERLKTNIGTYMEKIKSNISKSWSDIKTNVFKTLEGHVIEITTIYTTMKNNLDSRMSIIKTAVSTKWNEIKNACEKVVGAMRDSISGGNGIFNDLRTKAVNIFSTLNTNLNGGDGWFNKIKGSAETIFTNMKNSISGSNGTFAGFAQNIKNTANDIWVSLTGSNGYFTALVSNINTLFNGKNGLGDILAAPFNGLKNGIAAILQPVVNLIFKMANGVINAVNAITGALNKLSFTAPSWLPDKNLAGKSWGFDIKQVPNVNPPKLATGTVVPPSAGNFLAMLGDNNRETEVVSPLSTMKQAMLEALSEAGSLGGNNIVIKAEGEMGALIRMLNLKLEEENSRVGKDFGRGVAIG